MVALEPICFKDEALGSLADGHGGDLFGFRVSPSDCH